MQNAKLQPKINKLFSYLYTPRYKKRLEGAVEQGFCDYGVLLVWKSFMMFVYEKIYQIDPKTKQAKFCQDRDFQKHYNERNFFWLNSVDDDRVISFLKNFYNIDVNYFKMANSLSQKRDVACHVSEKDFNMQELESYLNDILEICLQIQQGHKAYLENYKSHFSNVGTVDGEVITQELVEEKKFSNQDIRFFLGELIEQLQGSKSFNTAEKIERVILSLGDYLLPEDIEMVLKAIMGHKPEIFHEVSYHQIIEAGRPTADFLQKLAQKFPKNSSKAWEDFANFLSQEKVKWQRLLPYYNWLFVMLDVDTFPNKQSIG